MLFLLGSCSLFFRNESQRLRILGSGDGMLTPTLTALRQTKLDDGGFGAGGGPAEDAGGTGIVEPDVYWFDPSTSMLYLANAWRGLLAFSCSDPAAPAARGRVELQGIPRELYPKDSYIFLLLDPSPESTGSASASASASARSRTARTRSAGTSAAGTRSAIAVIDVAGAASSGLGSGSLRSRVELGGSLLDSRMAGGRLVIATREGTESVESGGTVTWSEKTRLWSVDPLSGSIHSFDIAGAVSAVHVASLPGGGAAAFVATGAPDGTDGSPRSRILRYDVEPDGSFAARGEALVAGIIADRFKMDYAGGFLRLVAFDPGWGGGSGRGVRRSFAFALDWRNPEAILDLSESGKALELAPGETLFATRFDGNRCYIVTYLTKDPLFVVSFADPERPGILGTLDVPGYSVHIELFDGPGGVRRLFAVGVEDSGRTKVSVFGVDGDGVPADMGSLSLGESWAWSAALYDWRRISRLASLGGFAVPYHEYRTGGGDAFSVALVSCGEGGPGLLCTLPGTGDSLRTVSVSDSIVYTVAADRMIAWRVNPGSAERLVTRTLAEDVRWATVAGGDVGAGAMAASAKGPGTGVGFKVAATDSGISVRTFRPGSENEIESLSALDIPAQGPDGSWTSWSFRQGWIQVIPGTRSLVIAGTRWNPAGVASLVLERIDADSSMVLSRRTPLALPVESSKGGYLDHALVGFTPAATHLAAFHGIVTLVDVQTWTASAKCMPPRGAGLTAVLDGTTLWLFGMEEGSGSRSGYGRIGASQWDIEWPSSPVLKFETGFAGYPVAAAGGGRFISAYPGDEDGKSTVLLGTAVEPGSCRILDERELTGSIRASASLSGEAVLLSGDPDLYWPVYASGASPGTGSGSGAAARGARLSASSTKARMAPWWSGTDSGSLVLHHARIKEGEAGTRGSTGTSNGTQSLPGARSADPGSWSLNLETVATLPTREAHLATAGERVAVAVPDSVQIYGPDAASGNLRFLAEHAAPMPGTEYWRGGWGSGWGWGTRIPGIGMNEDSIHISRSWSGLDAYSLP